MSVLVQRPVGASVLMTGLLGLATVIGCSFEESRWEEAQAQDTVESYEAFLEKYPESEYRSEAEARVSELEFRNSWIVFASTLSNEEGDKADHTYVFRMRVDGSQMTQVTSGAADDWDPDLSPDGQQIVFASDRADSKDIYVISLDGSGLTRLTQDAGDNWDPTWSPDGRQIAFSSTRDGNGEIYVMNADGTDVARLTENEFGDGDPTWSPDGQRIAYVSFRDGSGFEIYVMNADGDEVNQLTDGPDFNLAPAWAPGGGRIAYTAWRTEDLERDQPFSTFHLQNSGKIILVFTGLREIVELQGDLLIIDIDDGTTTTLVDDEASSWAASFSVNGQYLVYTSNQGGSSDVYLMKLDGSEAINLTANDAQEYSPSW